MIGKIPDCMKCKKYDYLDIDKLSCNVYPEGIPASIITGEPCPDIKKRKTLKLSEGEIKLLQMDEEGVAYLEYNEKIGGEPIGLTAPFGYPGGVDERGGVCAVFKECIEKGVTWEELLNYNEPDPDAII